MQHSESPTATRAQLVNELLTNAALHSEWPIEEHQTFVKSITDTTQQTMGILLDHQLPAGAPVDARFDPPRDAPCGLYLEPFDHAIDVDCEPDTGIDQELIDQAKQLCSTCPVQNTCLEYGISPPELRDGVLGGQTKTERWQAWNKKMGLRTTELQGMYRVIGERLMTGLADTNEDDKFLARLRILMEFIIVQPKTERDPSVIMRLVTDEKLIERAKLVLYPTAQSILQYWIDAVQQGRNPLEYGPDNPLLSHQKFLKREQYVEQTLLELSEGTFNYRRWFNLYTGQAPCNAITFLVAIREEIPDGSGDQLNQIAFQRLVLLDGPRANRFKELLTAHYGLNGEEPLEVWKLARLTGLADSTIRTGMGVALQRLRKMLGNEVRDEP